MATILQAMGADPSPAGTYGPEWEIAEFPIAVIVPQYEMGSRGDVLLTVHDKGISLGDRIWGGIDNLMERVQAYWNDEIVDYLDQIREDADSFEAFQDDEGLWYADRESMLTALEEAIHDTPKNLSSHIVLENADDRDYTKLMPASTVVEYLNLRSWVDERKPNVVVLRHVNWEKHELTGTTWKVPGNYRILTTTTDIPDIHGGDFPMVAYYVEPTD
jgi:hypothetical protein